MKDIVYFLTVLGHVGILIWLVYLFVVWVYRKIKDGSYEYNSEKGIREYHYTSLKSVPPRKSQRKPPIHPQEVKFNEYAMLKQSNDEYVFCHCQHGCVNLGTKCQFADSNDLKTEYPIGLVQTSSTKLTINPRYLIKGE